MTADRYVNAHYHVCARGKSRNTTNEMLDLLISPQPLFLFAVLMSYGDQWIECFYMIFELASVTQSVFNNLYDCQL